MALYVAFGRDSVRPLIFYLLAFGLFAQLRTLTDDAGMPVQYEYAIDLERALFGDVPSVWLQERLYEPARASLVNVYASVTYLSYFLVAHVIILAAWWRQRERFALYAAAVLATLYLGVLGSLLLPTAPPWLAAREGLVPETSRVFRELAAVISPGSYEQGLQLAGANDVAAMPSLHMAVTVVVAICLWRLGPWARALGLIYAASMAFALVYLGEHYFIDVIAGVFTAALGWAIACRCVRPAAASLPVASLQPASRPALDALPAPSERAA
jgi:membrane-associated phospholipid phosphatase